MQSLEVAIYEQAIERFKALSCFEDILQFCKISTNLNRGKVILRIDCPSEIADALSDRDIDRVVRSLRDKADLLSDCAEVIGLGSKIKIYKRGTAFATVPIPSQTKKQGDYITMVPTKNGTISNYTELLLHIAKSPYPAFVTEVPKNWYWGQPIRVVLTSAQVTNFSGRKATRWHGDDISVLYRKEDLEPQIEMLLRELERSPDKHVIVPDVEYRSFTVDTGRDYLFPSVEHEYNSDFEMVYLPDLDSIIRICYCKERRILSR